MSSFRNTALPLAFAMTLCLSVTAISSDQETKAADIMDGAWKEYQYREFSSAESMFDKALRIAESDEEKLQALTGKAFCRQFGPMALAGEGDYSAAIAIYKQCQQIAGANPHFAPFFKAMIAECSYRIYSLNGDEEKLRTAEALWNELQTSSSNSVPAQEALLFRTIMETKNYNLEDNKERMKRVADRLASSPVESDADAMDANALLPVMADYLYYASFWGGDYKGSVKWLEKYLELGPTSYAAAGNTVFRIAKTSEVKLKDYGTAAKYYAIFAKDFPSNNRRYFAQQKAAELGKEASKKEAGK